MTVSASHINASLHLIAGAIYHISFDLENCRDINDEILLKELANIRDSLSRLEVSIDDVCDIDLKREFQTELADLRLARMLLSNMLSHGAEPLNEREYREDVVVPPDMMVYGGFVN